MSYATRFNGILFSGDIRKLDALPITIKNYAIKSLILISKYLGTYPTFKAQLLQYGVKVSKPDSMTAFLRIMNASNSDILEYYQKLQSFLKPNQVLAIKLMLHGGQRTTECINLFNLIIQLHKQNKLNTLYNSEIGCTMQFKFGKLFLRGKKNSFITFITPEFLQQIANSESVSYASLRKTIEKKKLKLRLCEFRDKFGTHLLDNGILEAEQNLCCGRIASSVFIKFYWSPKLKQLGDRILKALQTIETA